MATFFPFVTEGAHSGQQAQLKTRAIIWLNVGIITLGVFKSSLLFMFSQGNRK